MNKENKLVTSNYQQGLDLIDLHIHSCYSDGEYTPYELIKMAQKRNVGTIAITDHDTLLGNKDIAYNLKENSVIKIIPGIELSAKTDNGTMHILGYGIDINNKELNDKTIELKNNSIYSIMALMSQLKKDYSIVFQTEDIKKLLTTNRNIGRPDLARLCMKYGYANTVQEAFDKYLIDANRKTKQTNKGIPYEECIELIKHAGGIPVLAHPKTLNKTDKELLTLIKEMIKDGLQGIEAYHSRHTQEEMTKYSKIATELNLLISGGSDYHGPIVKPDIEIGTGKRNNLKIKKLTILDRLK